MYQQCGEYAYTKANQKHVRCATTSHSFCETFSYEPTTGFVICLLNELQGHSLEGIRNEVRLAPVYELPIGRLLSRDQQDSAIPKTHI